MSNTVYLFNCVGDAARIQVNNGYLVMVAGWSTESGSMYLPRSVAISKSTTVPQQGIFGPGANQLMVTRDRSRGSTVVEIDTHATSSEDLVLQLFMNNAVLSTIHGQVVGISPVQVDRLGGREAGVVNDR